MNIDEASVATLVSQFLFHGIYERRGSLPRRAKRNSGSHCCTEERKSAIGSRKFNRYLLAIYDYRLAVFNIAPTVQECDAREGQKRYIAGLKKN